MAEEETEQRGIDVAIVIMEYDFVSEVRHRCREDACSMYSNMPTSTSLQVDREPTKSRSLCMSARDPKCTLLAKDKEDMLE